MPVSSILMFNGFITKGRELRLQLSLVGRYVLLEFRIYYPGGKHFHLDARYKNAGDM